MEITSFMTASKKNKILRNKLTKEVKSCTLKTIKNERN